MMPTRSVVLTLALAALAGHPAVATARPQPAAKERSAARQSPNGWVAMVVTRITEAGEKPAVASPAGTVTIRVRIGADGTMEGAAVDETSGSDALDERALQAAKAASPFTPPPQTLLTLEGFTELTFPVEFGAASR